jgi:hypothetical protein
MVVAWWACTPRGVQAAVCRMNGVAAMLPSPNVYSVLGSMYSFAVYNMAWTTMNCQFNER